MATEAVLSAHGLVVRRGAVRVLDGVDLTLQPGETAAVQGPSGCGKSTLLSALCGLLVPDAGTVIVAGKHLTGQSDRVRSRVRLGQIGVVFQGDEFVPELTLRENIKLPLLLGKRHDRPTDIEARVDALAARLRIDEVAHRTPSEVSGGQLQRAAIARAVAARPAVILADEPTGSLDEHTARDAVRLLLEVAAESTAAVVVVTHDDEVARACGTHYRMEQGALRASTKHDHG